MLILGTVVLLLATLLLLFYGMKMKMLEKENPDGTVIVGPPSLHCQAGMACIERKIPFFCEKPSAPDAAGAETLAAAARNAAVSLIFI